MSTELEGSTVTEETILHDEEKYCRTFLKEDPDTRMGTVEMLRKWLIEQKNLNPKIDDFNIIRFLRTCKYDVEDTKRRLRHYYLLKGNTPQWFSKRDPTIPVIQQLLSIGVFMPLKEPDDNGRIPIIIRAAAHSPKNHSQDDLFKTCLMVLDWMLEAKPETSVYGVVPIIDLAGISFSHARQLTIPIIKRAVHSWQDCYPVRVRSIEFVNTPPYVDVVLNIFRSFMSAKLKERVHVHGYNFDSLHKYVPKRLLPEEYDGEAGSAKLLADYWRAKVTDEFNWFVNDEKYKAANTE